MSIFICWSGNRSKELAEFLSSEWLPIVLGPVQTFVSSDIPKGELWFSIVRKQLQDAQCVIFCMTQEAVRSPWMHFEVGALFGATSKKKVLGYLLDVPPSELSGSPLSHFQNSAADKTDTRKLVKGLSEVVGTYDDEKYEKAWPAMEAKLQALRHAAFPALVPDFSQFLQSKTFSLSVDKCLDQNWIDRYARVLAAMRSVNDWLEHYGTGLSQPTKDTLLKLRSALDQYKRFLEQLTVNQKFPVLPGQIVDFANPKGGGEPIPWIGQACSDVIDTIRSLVQTLGDVS